VCVSSSPSRRIYKWYIDGSRVYSNAIQIHTDCRDDCLDTTCRLLEEIGDRNVEAAAKVMGEVQEALGID
jgi:hypothetical protein